jgi:hypothetical protein
MQSIHKFDSLCYKYDLYYWNTKAKTGKTGWQQGWETKLPAMLLISKYTRLCFIYFLEFLLFYILIFYYGYLQ